jgi:hypothetical protein
VLKKVLPGKVEKREEIQVAGESGIKLQSAR